jgi:hypothetical protein
MLRRYSFKITTKARRHEDALRGKRMNAVEMLKHHSLDAVFEQWSVEVD